MHRTTVWITHADHERLHELACRTRRTRSDIIRQGIELVMKASTPRTSRIEEEIVSPRVLDLPRGDWPFTATEDTLISLRNTGRTTAELAEALALTEDQILTLLQRIDAKMDEFL